VNERNLPYGYEARDGRIVVNEEQMEQVRWLLAEAAEGRPLLDLARLINQVERERIQARMREGREQAKARRRAAVEQATQILKEARNANQEEAK
jgi:DNA invertase Pin-like site-specific DNA recombinase